MSVTFKSKKVNTCVTRHYSGGLKSAILSVTQLAIGQFNEVKYIDTCSVETKGGGLIDFVCRRKMGLSGCVTHFWALNLKFISFFILFLFPGHDLGFEKSVIQQIDMYNCYEILWEDNRIRSQIQINYLDFKYGIHFYRIFTVFLPYFYRIIKKASPQCILYINPDGTAVKRRVIPLHCRQDGHT